MRLLVISHLSPPDRGGGAALFGDLCVGLAERGVEVTLRTAYPHYPEWRDKSGRNGLAIDIEHRDNLRIERFGCVIPTRPAAVADRLVMESSWLASLMRRPGGGGRFDVVMAFCPMMAAVAYGRWLRQWSPRTRFWVNVQDLPADAAAGAGMSSAGRTATMLASVQRRLFSSADLMSTISPTMATRLREVTDNRMPVHVLPNFLNRSMATAIDSL